MGWPSVNGFSDGDLVTSEVLNRPIAQLSERTEYLLGQVGASSRAASVSGPASDGLYVGAVAYRDSAGVFRPALAGVCAGNDMSATESTMAVGVVSAISGSTATVVTSGLVSLNAPASTLVDGAAKSGPYYLSHAAAGRVSSSPSLPCVYVGDYRIVDGIVESVIVNPSARSLGEAHTHRAFRLSGSPISPGRKDSAGHVGSVGLWPSSAGSGAPILVISGTWCASEALALSVSLRLYSDGSLYKVEGTCTAGGSTTIIPLTQCGTSFSICNGMCGTVLTGTPGSYTWNFTAPDDVNGWALSDGRYKLNLGMYPEVSSHLPFPYTAAALTVDGVEANSSELFSGDDVEWGIEDGYIVWYDIDNPPFTVVDSQITPGDIVLYTSRSTAGNNGLVTSLTAAPGSPIKITAYGTSDKAYQGDLQVSLDLGMSTEDTGKAGYNVVKAINGGKFESGPVVEKIVAGSGLTVASSTGPDGTGIVTLQASDGVYSGEFETIALENAKRAVVGGMFPYVKLLGGSTKTAFVAKFRVPDEVIDGSYNVVLSMSLFAEQPGAAGSSIGLEAKILPDQGDSNSFAAVAGSYNGVVECSPAAVDVSFPTGYTAYDPILVTGMSNIAQSGQRLYSPALVLDKPVRPGYFVGVRLYRPSGSSASYDIGVVSLRWKLVKVGS